MHDRRLVVPRLRSGEVVRGAGGWLTKYGDDISSEEGKGELPGTPREPEGRVHHPHSAQGLPQPILLL